MLWTDARRRDRGKANDLYDGNGTGIIFQQQKPLL